MNPLALNPLELNPLELNPAYHAPPRLFERPFKNIEPVSETCTQEEMEEMIAQDAEDQLTAKAMEQEPADYFFTSLAPRPPSPPSNPARASPPPLSRWSESTIASLDFEVNQDDQSDEDATSDSEDDEDVLQMRRLSSRRLSRRSSHRAAALQTLSLNLTYSPYNLPTAPKRPPMKSLDSVEQYMRRGGWKRRGIVFRAEDAEDMETATREPGERASF